MGVRAAFVATCALLLTGVASAASTPYLKSTAASRGHVVAVFTQGSAETDDSVPSHIAVATKAATQYNGSFIPANVRVSESMSNVTRTAAGLRARTVHKLKPGRYYVKVSTIAIGLDCTPKLPCKELWSNARRVVIPRPK
ncbi:MAG TPA: hypothetical protein VF232_00035 [Gaiellaceae bacterium]